MLKRYMRKLNSGTPERIGFRDMRLAAAKAVGRWPTLSPPVAESDVATN